jgi:hypothetical protein
MKKMNHTSSFRLILLLYTILTATTTPGQSLLVFADTLINQHNNRNNMDAQNAVVTDESSERLQPWVNRVSCGKGTAARTSF